MDNVLQHKLYLLLQFIETDQFLQSFISNVTCGHGVSVNNFEYLTTLSLSMAVHLDRFVCPHKSIKEFHQVYHILYGNPASSSISHLLETVRHFYRPGMSPKQAQMTFKNRLQVFIITSTFNQFSSYVLSFILLKKYSLCLL